MADTLEHKEDTQFIVSNPRIVLYSEYGDAVIVSKTGSFDRRSKLVQLTGGVVMTIDDGENTRVEVGDIASSGRDRTASSDGDVSVTRTSMSITGHGLDYGPATDEAAGENGGFPACRCV